MIQTRRHIVHRSRDIAGSHEAETVTLPRAPWEPRQTSTGHRPETAPDPRLALCRTETRRPHLSRASQVLAVIRETHAEAMEAPR